MRMSPACGRGWLSSAVRAGSSATFIYTKAMTQASFANAAEFFNSLLEQIPLEFTHSPRA
jgi:hypothetical protein